MKTSWWRRVISVAVVGVVGAALLLMGRAWLLPSIDAALSNLAASVGQARLLSSAAVYVLGTALACAVVGGLGGWLARRSNERWRRCLSGGLRWGVGLLVGNVVGLLALGRGVPALVQLVTRLFANAPVTAVEVFPPLLLTLFAPLAAGAVGVWAVGRPRGWLAALAGALSGLYALNSATSLMGCVVAALVMGGGAGGGVAARCARSRERSWLYVLIGALIGGGLVVLQLPGVLVTVLVVGGTGLWAIPLAGVAAVVGGTVSAVVVRRVYVRAGLFGCVLPALGAAALSVLAGDYVWGLCLIGALVVGAGLGGLLVRLAVAWWRRTVCSRAPWLPATVRLVLAGALAATVFLSGGLVPSTARPGAAWAAFADQAEAFDAHYRAALAQTPPLTPAELERAYRRSYRERIDFDPTQATFYDLVAGSLGLTSSQGDLLGENGFVVMQGPVYDSFGDAYEDIYRRDLPVFVTADSILHALHRSYDGILKDVERQVMIPQLADLLGELDRYVVQRRSDETDARLQSSLDEMHRYLTVAQALLVDAPPVDAPQAAVWFEQARRGAGTGEMVFFGEQREVDWTYFQPIGHYAESAELQAYFRAMRWLMVMDWRLVTVHPATMEPSFHPQQAAAALSLLDAIEGTGALERWQDLDALLTLFAGTPDGMDLPSLQALRADAELEAPAAIFDPAVQAQVLELLRTGRYRAQQINDDLLWSDPYSAEPLPLPVGFALFQPRFAADGYVFSNVVFDRVVHQGQKVQRPFPAPLDVMFVLGNDYAATLLQDEMGRYPYQANLQALRTTVEGYDPSIWTQSLYGLWLQALRALNADTTASPYPQALQTEAWAAKVTQTQLFSWAQLRHDAALYVKQTMTFAALCDYPAGYVEPYPAFYTAVAQWARQARAGFLGLRWSSSAQPLRDRILSHLGQLEETVGRLEDLAQKELDGRPFSSDEEEFLRQVVVVQEFGCGPVTKEYEGWYPRLFYGGRDQAVEADPTVAPVHANLDPQVGPTGVLYVATGNVRLMVIAVDSGQDRAVYVGPLGSYYEFIEPHGVMLTDEMWGLRLSQEPPAQPDWWERFVK